MNRRLHVPSGWGYSGFVIAIPACNEEIRLPIALRALSDDGMVQDVIVIANGCSDDTARVAAAGHRGLHVAVLETDILPGGVGEARRLGMATALNLAPDTSILATTDADCRVGPEWGALTLATLRTADAICGRIMPEPAEFACLPALVREHGELEDRTALLEAELAGLQAPLSYDPLPRHGQTPGASLAFRTETYLAAGGFEAIHCHEDRRIVARIEAAGGRVARPYALHIIASCRTAGRAPGGMADTIAARAADAPYLYAEIARLRSLIVSLEAKIATMRATSLFQFANQGEQHVLSLE